ncbi:AraC family transcriptional regulator [[Pseudomonas] boreopolis]|uniref:AraC family transcriptional regulator n=1 Tax=Xanthomonas boreopolis TaxID=86183 RepID=UPI003D48B425
MRSRTGHAYRRAIERAVAHLQRLVQANAPLPDLDALAAVAHLSPFHFHRIYRALTGETVGNTVARLRMLRALRLLAEGDAPVARIALDVGYGTPQALARALRAAVGASPSELRSTPGLLQAKQRVLADPPAPDRPDATPLQVRVDVLAPFEVVTLRKRGAFDDLDRGFARLFGWAVREGIADRLQCLAGIPHGDHRDVPARALEFDCAMGFDAPVAPPSPFATRTLGGGRYALLRHVGPYDRLEDALDRLLAEWLPGSGHALRDAPVHYLFLDDPEEVPAAILRADVCVPLR